ncbi:hypothetical protein KGF56_002236 [Candida oxycetoniae]|uniref:Zn(2)-C6 fungal-type domain-containing protein n=1 Tax=Candida oxycetoniae TaxID=497107 RepID=A0AAI9WYM5_9ASCO|nr:uncharacterized protein KGF56_002236 [Candida oxycetoniae]KAI3404985.2 hypothetical protein KGF56_002236 [Candida oxycetoniae]
MSSFPISTLQSPSSRPPVSLLVEQENQHQNDQHDTFQSHQQKAQKRPYSRQGCRECKRRKIKCPEEKPFCSTCVRLGKTCSYPLAGEKVLRISRRLMREEIENLSKSGNDGSATTITTHFLPVQYDVPKRIKQHNGREEHKQQNQQQNQQNQQNQMKQQQYPQPEKRQTMAATTTLTPESESMTPSHLQQKRSLLNIENLINSNNNSNNNNNNNNKRTKNDKSKNNSISATTPNDHFDFFNGTDLSILTTDLSNLVNEIMEFSNVQSFQDDYQFDLFDNSPFAHQSPLEQHQQSQQQEQQEHQHQHQHYHQHHHHQQQQEQQLQQQQQQSSSSSQSQSEQYSATHNDDEHIANLPLNYIKLKRKHEVLYLEQFYNNFANIIEPFDAYHRQTKSTSKPARDMILKTASTEPFLLCAVLAEGAKTSYMKYKQPEDEKAYGAYLSRCLKLLELATKRGEVDNLNANIEAVLLTLLLLTAATATSTQQWRPHLTGCKDLLLKISTQSGGGGGSGSSGSGDGCTTKVSKILVFCKYWFLSIEILAGLSTNLGGTLQTDMEIDQLISAGNDYEISVLKEMDIITDQGFNIIMGFHNSGISIFRDLLKLLNKYRQNGDAMIEPMQNMKILAEFYKQSEIVFLDSRGVIPESQLHNKYTIGLPIEEIRIGEESFWLSWQDISHQSFILSSIIMILTRFFHLTSTNPNISIIVDKCVSFIHYLHQFSDVQQHASPFLLLMIQWPLLVTGLESTKKEQQELLLKYFAMIGQIGAATSNVSVQMLQRQWKKEITGRKRASDLNQDTLIY